MNWWQWLITVGITVFVLWGIVFAVIEYRAGTLRSSWSSHWADGCAKPIVESALRADGSRKNIIPRRGDAEVEELEHMLNHRMERS